MYNMSEMPMPTHVQDIFPSSCEQLQSTGNGHAFWLIKGEVIINFYQTDASVSFPKAFPTNFMYIFLIISDKLYF
jgi:hypothetical protein